VATRARTTRVTRKTGKPRKKTGARPRRRKPAIFDRAAAARRLSRIEGQVRGLERMIAAERPCPEVIAQIASAQQALRGVARELMLHHLADCEAAHLRRGSRRAAAATYSEILDDIYRHLR
jgi:DNA-binding FrmR family transcriptional regulator